MALAVYVKAPPRLPMSYIRLLVVKPTERFTVARLGPVMGMHTHWTGEKTVACGAEGQCQNCTLPKTWKGYVPAIGATAVDGNGRPAWKRCVLVVTPEITDAVDAYPVGQPFIICRPGRNKRSPMEVADTTTKGLENVPDSFFVLPYVLRAMGYPLDFCCRVTEAVQK